MEEKEQEYYWGGEYVTIYAEVKDKPELVVVQSDDNDLRIANKDRLVKREDSYSFKKAEERKLELEKITAEAKANLDQLVEEVIEKAISSLVFRMKINTVFGKDMVKAGSWAMQISDELEKLIKEKAPKTVKEDKADIFD